MRLIEPELEDTYSVGGVLKPKGKDFAQSCLQDEISQNGTTISKAPMRFAIKVGSDAVGWWQRQTQTHSVGNALLPVFFYVLYCLCIERQAATCRMEKLVEYHLQRVAHTSGAWFSIADIVRSSTLCFGFCATLSHEFNLLVAIKLRVCRHDTICWTTPTSLTVAVAHYDGVCIQMTLASFHNLQDRSRVIQLFVYPDLLASARSSVLLRTICATTGVPCL